MEVLGGTPHTHPCPRLHFPQYFLVPNFPGPLTALNSSPSHGAEPPSNLTQGGGGGRGRGKLVRMVHKQGLQSHPPSNTSLFILKWFQA